MGTRPAGAASGGSGGSESSLLNSLARRSATAPGGGASGTAAPSGEGNSKGPHSSGNSRPAPAGAAGGGRGGSAPKSPGGRCVEALRQAARHSAGARRRGGDVDARDDAADFANRPAVLRSHPLAEPHQVQARWRAGRVLKAKHDVGGEPPVIAVAGPDDPRGIDGDVRGPPCPCGPSCAADSGCGEPGAPAPSGADPGAPAPLKAHATPTQGTRAPPQPAGPWSPR